MIELNQILHADCMDIMKDIPDKYFELAIVDPPYDISTISHSRHGSTGSGKLKNRILNKSTKKFKDWDIKPDESYFTELFRVSKAQIIWGANNYILPPSRCFVVWDKEQPWENFSACEYAWTSFDKPAKIFREATVRTGEVKIHPTQKSVKLYKYLLHHFAKIGDKILDTHAGSCSSVIACIDMGFEYLAIEKDKDYYNAAVKRVEKENIKIKLF
jgi:site-specific DNA-methyltransferase (adenine-specific)